ncbi:MAG TPA: SET domain-containing protein-lysine N-methyltransferase, partial [Verrucomicrobiaceae bacterium]
MAIDKEPHYEIRSSGIHGRGLFARNPIKKDTWIVEYLGEKVDKNESERRSGLLLEKSRDNGSARVYTFVLNDEWDIDGGFEYNDARLVNHSCDPNTEAQVWDEKEIWFVALRDIAPGEELLYNYGFDLDSWTEHPCGCGSPRCPGFIADEDLWPRLKR